MEIISKKPETLVFKAKIKESLANAIRRYINKIPILAVDEIEISKNGSALFDETIAHRVGLVPLKMKKEFEKSPPVLELSAKQEGIIYSGQIKGKAEVVYDRIPITSLNKGQEIELKAITKIGKGTEHAKFSPGLIFYRNCSEIIVDKESAEEMKKTFPKIEIKEEGNKVKIIDENEKEIKDFVEGFMEKKKGSFETVFKEDLIIKIESFGQIPVEEIFTKSLEALKTELKELDKAI